MFDFLRRKPPRGTVWAGPAAFVDANEAAMLGIVPGHYALTDDGKQLRRPRVRLVAVDHAPGNPHDGDWHLEVAGKGDPLAKAGRPVEFKADVVNRTGVTA